MDGTIVNVALPEISSSFDADASLSSWIVTIYFLTLAGMVLVFGKLCDSGMIKRIVVWGFLVFSISSLACGLSQNIWMLLAFRAVQGIGASMLAASSVMLCVKQLPPNMTAYGLSVSIMGSFVGAAVGPILGGILAEALSWYWIFIINVPVGIVAAFIAGRVLPDDTGFDRSSFDYLGSAILFVSLVTGLFALETIPSNGVTPAAAVAAVVFAVTFSLFVIQERRTDAPVLRLSLFRNWRFSAVTVSYLVLNLTYTGCLYILPFFMTVELGYDTMTCGSFLLVTAIVTLVVCPLVGRKADTIGNRPFAIVGGVILAISMAIFFAFRPDSPLWFIILGFAVLGLVWGVNGGPMGSRLVENVPKDERGSGSSLISFYAYFGSALGTASFSGFFGLGSASAGQSMTALQPDVFMDGYVMALGMALTLAMISMVLSWAVREDGGSGISSCDRT